MAAVPLASPEVAAWKEGTATPVGPMEFQAILDTSRIYAAASAEFDDAIAPPPYNPGAKPKAMTEEDLWDRAMGG